MKNGIKTSASNAIIKKCYCVNDGIVQSDKVMRHRRLFRSRGELRPQHVSLATAPSIDVTFIWRLFNIRQRNKLICINAHSIFFLLLLCFRYFQCNFMQIHRQKKKNREAKYFW